jgi:hypothetical protein
LVDGVALRIGVGGSHDFRWRMMDGGFIACPRPRLPMPCALMCHGRGIQ